MRLIERLGEAVLGALSFMKLPLMNHPNKPVLLGLVKVQGDYDQLNLIKTFLLNVQPFIPTL